MMRVCDPAHRSDVFLCEGSTATTCLAA